MDPVIEDWQSGSENWRQVQLRVGDPLPYYHSGVAWRLVTWAWKYNDLIVFRVPDAERTRQVFKLSEMGLDLAAHTAFCRGDMPGPVYADWVEENIRDFPAVGLALLRGWIDHPELR